MKNMRVGMATFTQLIDTSLFSQTLACQLVQNLNTWACASWEWKSGFYFDRASRSPFLKLVTADARTAISVLDLYTLDRISSAAVLDFLRSTNFKRS